MKALGIEQAGQTTTAQKPGEWLASVEMGSDTFMAELRCQEAFETAARPARVAPRGNLTRLANTGGPTMTLWPALAKHPMHRAARNITRSSC